MKIIAFILAVCIISCCSAALSDVKKERLDAYKHACALRTRTDEAIVDVYHQSLLKGEKFTQDPKLGCYFFCFLKLIGIQRPCGAVEPSDYIKVAELENFDLTQQTDVIDKCKNRSAGSNGCENASNFVSCFTETKKFYELNV